MADLGYKNDGDTAIAQPAESKKEPKVQYPSLNIYKNVPGFLMEKELGHTCRLEVVAKVISKAERDNGNDLTLEIQSIDYVGKAGKKSKEEYMKMSQEERDDYDKKDKKIEDEE